ncbi:hypothetical protein D3C73_1341910 [compost metagenome]
MQGAFDFASTICPAAFRQGIIGAAQLANRTGFSILDDFIASDDISPLQPDFAARNQPAETRCRFLHEIITLNVDSV